MKLPPLDIVTTTFENGFRVLIVEDHHIPIVTSTVWYAIGSAHESDGMTGISHFLEHLLFDGTVYLTQEQIGERLGLSRIKVSRLLQQAREAGIVQIAVIPPQASNAALERRLETRYGLDEAIVVSPSSQEPSTIVR